MGFDDLNYRRIFLKEQAEWKEQSGDEAQIVIIRGYPLFVGSDNWFAAQKRLGN